MIYFVDEDVNETEPFAIELEIRGYETSILTDADEAFSTLLKAKNIEAVVLDVMLATAESGISRYNATETENFTTTGLSLLDDLVLQFKEKKDNTIPRKVILFSAAQRNWIVSKIEEKANEHGIRYLDKKNYDDTFTFAEAVIDIINN